MSTPARPRSSRRANVVAVSVIAVVVLGLVLQRWAAEPSTPEATSASGTTSTGPGDAGNRGTARLSAQSAALAEAWTQRDRRAFMAAAGASAAARAWALRTYASLRMLDVQEFDARFVVADATSRQADGTFQTDVDVSWTPARSRGSSR